MRWRCERGQVRTESGVSMTGGSPNVTGRIAIRHYTLSPSILKHLPQHGQWVSLSRSAIQGVLLGPAASLRAAQRPLRGHSRVARVLSITLELSAKPIEYRLLIVQRGSPYLGKELQPVGFGQRRVRQPLVAVAADRAEVLGGILSALGLVDDMADVKPDSSASPEGVGIPGSYPAHLAGIAIALEDLRSQFLGHIAPEPWESGNTGEHVLVGPEVCPIFVGEYLVPLLVAQFAKAPPPF